MTERTERCVNCKWWDMDTAEEWYEGNDMPRTSNCHRYPPIIRPLPGEQLDGMDTRFPVTLESEYCGEFTPRPVAE